MKFIDAFNSNKKILMEGAIGERLKNEFFINYDSDGVAMASLINLDEGRIALKEIFGEYISIAERYSLPLMIMTPTRRANKERIEAHGFDKPLIIDNVKFLSELRSKSSAKVYIGGLMGCRGDAYNGEKQCNIDEAYSFHKWQADVFYNAGVDYLYAGIMPEIQEAIGMAKAMEVSGLPYIISFMLGDDGCLLDGTSLDNAIQMIDDATERHPLCYMSNCIHPERLMSTLTKAFNMTDRVRNRFRGVQVNSSPLSPEELDGCNEIQSSDPISLANAVEKLNKVIDIQILGGCCGTSKMHIEEFGRRLSSWKQE